MRVQAFHLPHFHGVHLHPHQLNLPWPKNGSGFEIAMDLGLVLLGTLLALWLFVPGVLH